MQSPSDNLAAALVAYGAPPSTDPAMDSAKLFPFFNLPRELRNMIYEELEGRYHAEAHMQIPGQQEGIRTCFHRLWIPRLLLVCKQFGKEYFLEYTKSRLDVTVGVTEVPPREIPRNPTTAMNALWNVSSLEICAPVAKKAMLG